MAEVYDTSLEGKRGSSLKHGHVGLVPYNSPLAFGSEVCFRRVEGTIPHYCGNVVHVGTIRTVALSDESTKVTIRLNNILTQSVLDEIIENNKRGCRK